VASVLPSLTKIAASQRKDRGDGKLWQGGYARVERAEAKRQERVRQKVGELHRPEPIVELDRREERNIRERPSA